MNITEFWESVHKRNETLWLTNSNPDSVYNMHQFPLQSSEIVLEVGVGTGRSVKAHAARGNIVLAVDISQEALTKVSSVSRTYLTEQLPNVESGTVDKALCHLVFQHCSTDVLKFILTEVIRTLKPGSGVFHFQFAELPDANVSFDESYKFAISNGIMFFRNVEEMTQIVNECGGEVVFNSAPTVWTTQYNITWYMMQVKKRV